MTKQAHIFYSGRVQGVGFRYTAEDIANELNVYGWVKNLSDARVEIVVEQEEKILQQFLERIEQFFKDYITDKEINWRESTGEWTDFSIRF